MFSFHFIIFPGWFIHSHEKERNINLQHFLPPNNQSKKQSQGHWTGNYIGTQSFIMLSYLLAYKLYFGGFQTCIIQTFQPLILIIINNVGCTSIYRL